MAVLLLVWCLAAGAVASGLDDISNNLATDIGPLLALFGEKITIQYFSESTSVLDYIIFAMAPIGIVTAMSSAIRVCGGSSLRAFIGRAQEGDGAVEAELCTSTSRDVCELFHRGGIVRVFGRPKILEILYLGRDAEMGTENGRPVVGIHLFRQYLRQPSKNAAWIRQAPRRWFPESVGGYQLTLGKRRQESHDLEQADKTQTDKAQANNAQVDEARAATMTADITSTIPNALKGTTVTDPNASPKLSLPRPEQVSRLDLNGSADLLVKNPNITINVGIVRLPEWYSYLVATIGVLLQSGVVAMAAVMTWELQWTQEGAPTGLVNVDVAVSENNSPISFIVGTFCLCLGMLGCAALIGESTEERRYERKSQQSRLIWLQPGNQVVGDETFDAFAYVEGTEHEPLSGYTTSTKRKPSTLQQRFTWLALLFSLGGYVAQFIGLRGMNASVAIAQLGITLVMSLLRASLRMRRLQRTDNRLAATPDLVVGHELDWLALEIAALSGPIDPSENPGPVDAWIVTGQCVTPNPKDPEIGDAVSADKKLGDAATLLQYRVRLADLTGHRPPKLLGPGSVSQLEASSFEPWSAEQVCVRQKAQELAQALCGAAEALLRRESREAGITLRIEVAIRHRVPPPELPGVQKKGSYWCFWKQETIEVKMDPAEDASVRSWNVDSATLEGILGLWLWSLIQAKEAQYLKRDRNHASAYLDASIGKIICGDDFGRGDTTEIQASMGMELDLWLGQGVVKPQAGCLNLGKSLKSWQTSPSLPSLSPESKDREVHLKPHYSTLEWEASLGNSWLSPVSLSDTHWPFLDTGTWIFHKYIMHTDSHKFQRKLFFGWHAIPSLGPGPLVPPEEANVIYVNSQNDLLTECCHQLFSTLLLSIATQERPNFEDVTVSGSGDSLRLEDTRISHMISAFTDSGLGSRADAVLSIIPILRPYIKPHSSVLLNPSDPNSPGQSEHENLRAEVLLHWTYLHCRTAGEQNFRSDADAAVFATSLIAVCERYRRKLEMGSLVDPSSGCDGLKRLLIKYRACGAPAEEILSQYTMVATLALAYQYPKPNVESFMGDLKVELPENIPQVTDLVKLVANQEKTATLYLICIVDPRLLATDYEAALPLSARNGWDEVVVALLRLGAVVDGQDGDMRTALSHCAEQGFLSLIAALLDGGANPDLPDQWGRTPLWYAAKTGHLDEIRMLSDTGKVDLDAVDAEGRSPLSHAAESGWRDFVRLLRDSGRVQLNRMDHRGRTPFSYAAGAGHEDVLKLLFGANHECPDYEGKTALHWAAGSHHVSVVYYLVTHGCALSPRDNHGWTPLMLAAQAGLMIDCVKLLYDRASAPGGYADDMGRTAHWWALRNGHIEMAAVLQNLQRDEGGDTASLNANPDLRDEAGRAPLWWAARDGNTSMVNYLLYIGADPSTSDMAGQTPLLWAVRKQHSEIVRLLLETKKAQPSKRGGQGRTPLMWAARGGNLAIVRMLIETEQADLTARDYQGMTAVAWAEQGGHTEIQAGIEAAIEAAT
ncbi:ankyrin [Thozetella sp. PMI_491]|nr:ankyrin [Thozetella sp. PMI_491]